MNDTKSIAKEILVFPARLIWVVWRMLDEGLGENQSFLKFWKSTRDEFWAEASRGGRFAFAAVGSLGIYFLAIRRIIAGVGW